MKKSYFLLIIVLVILVAAVILRLTAKPVSDLPAENLTPNNPVATSMAVSPNTEPAGEVLVTSPVAGALITSPLQVTGQAKGNWFFEASLPLRLVDADNNLVTSSPAQAQGGWMTTSSVPFTGTLTFTTDATSGFLIVAKDNPSGLPANDAVFRVPVRFK